MVVFHNRFPGPLHFGRNGKVSSMKMGSAGFDPLWIKEEGVTNDNGADRVVTMMYNKLL